ncbi:MAG: sigma-54-dependent Fis family transcriptional regulator [Nitrospinae bacterium]|nr:sigma-54-dependent Fis family transcriptional regulator [Nitrospinota bacterium]
MNAGSALIVDLDRHAVESLRGKLERLGWAARAAYAWQEVDRLEIYSGRFDIIFADPRFPTPGPTDIMAHIRSKSPGSPIVILLGGADEALEKTFLHAGAICALTKPYSDETLERAIAMAGSGAGQERDFCGIIGRAEKMLGLYETIRSVAGTDSAVLIHGETGVGKELIAAAVHKLSRRGGMKFVTINCGALSESLLESELFGHEKGAFTGAIREKPGKFEIAHGGTLFLDEIGEISPATQVKLLKALETGEVERLGSNTVIKTDIRLIFATNRDLAADVAEGRFRRDLYYRINTFPVHVPPLRERPGDIPALAEHFLLQYAARHGRAAHSIDPAAMAKLAAARWDGNVRELENAMERAVIVARDGIIREADVGLGTLPVKSEAQEGLAALPYRQMREKALIAVERNYFQSLLARFSGNISAVAQQAGLDRKTLYSKMKAAGVDPSGYRRKGKN